VLDPVTQAVSVQPAGDPAVDESWWIPHAGAVIVVKSARDGALPKVSASLSSTLAGARTKLVNALMAFDKSAGARFTALDITADGIIVRGTIRTGGRLDAVVHYVDVDGGKSVSAGASWIPGGRIDTFVWSWVKRSIIPWNSTTDESKDADRFLWEKTAEAIASGSLCLQILGKRLTPDGVEEPVEAGEVCSAQGSHPPMSVYPYWWMKIHVPVWLPDPPHDFVPNDRLAGHVSVVGDTRAPATNVLVHFTGRLGNRPLRGLARALEMMQQRDVSLVIVLVLPTGTFDGRGKEIEEQLGLPGERFGADLVLTEDYVRGWSTAFAAPDGPSTYLVNARAEFVWKQDGELDAGAVARARRACAAGPAAGDGALRLGIEPGTPAFDTVFTDERGEQTSFRRLRGRRVLLTFWQSWSAPCLRELRRLEQARADRGAPFVLAVNGGEEREVLAEVRRKNGLSFPLIYDPDQLIAGLYGVRCWPTTISINEAGFVDRVQLGLAHAAPVRR
jgi:peroxiredoxin